MRLPLLDNQLGDLYCSLALNTDSISPFSKDSLIADNSIFNLFSVTSLLDYITSWRDLPSVIHLIGKF